MTSLSDTNFKSFDPLTLLKLWMQEVEAELKLNEPKAFVLATSTPDGCPSTRTVLLKEITEEGKLCFYTNYLSPKGQNILSNSSVALTFFWDQPLLQIHIQGQASIMDPALSDLYWNSRPRSSQLSQWASQQSKPIENRRDLDLLYSKAENLWINKTIPRPSHWGGIEIVPDYFEFWVGHPNRFHDRYSYKKNEDSWSTVRLQP